MFGHSVNNFFSCMLYLLFFTDKLPKQSVTTFVITAPMRNVLVKGYLSGKLILQMKKFNSVILFLSTHTKICNASDTCHAHCA